MSQRNFAYSMRIILESFTTNVSGTYLKYTVLQYTREWISDASAGGSRLASLDRDASRNDSRRSTMHDGGMTSWLEWRPPGAGPRLEQRPPPLCGTHPIGNKGQGQCLPETDLSNLKAPLLRNGLVSIHRGSRAAATIYADRGIPHHGNPPTPHMTKGIPSRQDGGQRVWTVFMREALIRRAAVTDVPRRAVSRAYRFTSISVVLTAGSCRKKEPTLATPATELTADHWYGLARDRDGSMPSTLRPFCVACVAGGSRCWDRVAASTI